MPPVDSAVAEVSPAAAEGPAPDSPAKLHHQFLAQPALANRNPHCLMDLIRRMDACDGHVEYACPTLAHYLELVCGVSRIAARRSSFPPRISSPSSRVPSPAIPQTDV